MRTTLARSHWTLPLREYFFETQVPFGMALLRIILPLVCFVDLIQRWRWVREIYSADGAPAALSNNFGYPGLLPEFPGSVAVALFTALLFLLLCASAGWMTRFSLLTITALYAYFTMQDAMGTVTKYTVIMTHLFLILGVSNCSSIWSVDAWLKRRRSGGIPMPAGRLPSSEIWSIRLVQLLFANIYLGAAITKVHTAAFFTGDQLMFWMMTHINREHPLGEFLSQYPVMLAMFGYITVVWEIIFFPAAMSRWGRIPTLLIGASFHIMTTFTLGLYIFPTVMITSYLTFFNDRDYLAVRNWLKSKRLLSRMATIPGAIARRFEGWARPAWLDVTGFVTAALAVATLGVTLEYAMDVYGERGPNGPLTLIELSPERVQQLMSRDTNLRPSDMFLAVDLGTVMMGEHLVNRRVDFRQGEQILAQVTMNPPHPDMWVDCFLLDSTGQIVTRSGNIVAREAMRVNYNCPLDVEPGEYTCSIRSGGKEMVRRKLTVHPRVSTAAAN